MGTTGEKCLSPSPFIYNIILLQSIYFSTFTLLYKLYRMYNDCYEDLFGELHILNAISMMLVDYILLNYFIFSSHFILSCYFLCSSHCYTFKMKLLSAKVFRIKQYSLQVLYKRMKIENC